MKPSKGFVIASIVTIVIGAIGISAAILWKRAVSRDVNANLYIAPEVELTREMRWLRDYVRIDTSNPPGNETAGARFLQNILREHGIDSEIVESAPGRGSLYARIRGRNPGDALMLLHHIDVVPADPEGWRFPPFDGEVVQGYLWGRGTLDMKGIGIAHLAAFLELARLPAAPERDVVFLAVADEEEGSALGMQWLLANRPDIFEGVTACLNEGGITEMIGGEVKYFGIEVGSMAASRWRFESSDLRSVQKARIALEPFISPVEPIVIEPTIEEYYAAVAPHRIVFVDQLRDIGAAIERGDYFQVGDEYRFRMELRVRTYPIESSEGTSELSFYAYAPPAIPFTEVERHIRETLAGVQGELTLEVAEPVAPFSPTDTELFRAIGTHVRRVLGDSIAVGPYTTTGVMTDSRFLRQRGVVCYGFWPYPVDYFSTTTLHSVGERVRLDYFQRGVDLTRSIVLDVAG